MTDPEKFAAVRDGITFDLDGAASPRRAVIGEKDGLTYFSCSDIGAADLDTACTLTIGDTALRFTVLDYARLVLGFGMPQADKDLAAAAYWYNQAANAYFSVNEETRVEKERYEEIEIKVFFPEAGNILTVSGGFNPDEYEGDITGGG